jgi:hypothetical protein
MPMTSLPGKCHLVLLQFVAGEYREALQRRVTLDQYDHKLLPKIAVPPVTKMEALFNTAAD